MRHKSGTRGSGSEKLIRTIKRKTRRQYSAEEKIRIVLDGLRGEASIAEMRTAMAKASEAVVGRPLATSIKLPDMPKPGFPK